MTDKNTNGLSKLNAALETRGREQKATDDLADAPEWAKALLEGQKKNTEELKAIRRRRKERRRKTNEFLKNEVAPGMQRNARNLCRLAQVTRVNAPAGVKTNGSTPPGGIR